MSTTSTDSEQLRLLAIFHYVVGGIVMLFACMPVIHLTIGIMMIAAPEKMGGGNPPPAFVGWLFTVLGGFFFLCGQALAVCILLSGKFLMQGKHYLFVFVIACLQCLFMPFGTVLGVFTIIVLSRPSVKELFPSVVGPGSKSEDRK